jgi:hypothetical protein
MNKIMYMLQKLYYQVLRLIPPTSGRMLNNKWILYFIFVVGMVDVVNFYQRGNLMAVAVFCIVGFLTSFFSKNMIVIIVMAIAVSHLVTYGNRMSEGMKDGEEEPDEDEEEDGEEGFEDDEEKDEDENDDEAKEEKPKEGMKEKSKDEKPKDVSTSDLLKKQGELMEKMSQLEPLLNRAESLFKTQKTDGFQNMAKSTPFSEYH